MVHLKRLRSEYEWDKLKEIRQLLDEATDEQLDLLEPIITSFITFTTSQTAIHRVWNYVILAPLVIGST
jgi:hypothetical protein